MEPLEQLLVDLCNNDELRIPNACLKPMSLGAPATDTKDNPLRGTIVDGDGKRRGVLFLASELEPGLVQQSVDRAAEAKKCLNEYLSPAVLEPLASGYWNDLSFVVWPWVTPLSQSRLLGYIQRTRLRRWILAWIADVANSTQLPVSEISEESEFAIDLQRIVDDMDMPDAMRTAAQQGLDEISTGTWSATHILEHGDFWMGNILRSPIEFYTNPYKISVIDWAGSRTIGYPFIDLIRFGLSSRMPAKALREQVLHHCEILSCSPVQAKYSVLGAMGYLGAHLGYFPRDRYLSLAQDVYQAIVDATETNA